MVHRAEGRLELDFSEEVIGNDDRDAASWSYTVVMAEVIVYVVLTADAAEFSAHVDTHLAAGGALS